VGSGTTTVVDNVIWGNRGHLTQEVLNLYQQVGLRAIYARMFTDIPLAESVPLVSSLQRKEPSVRKVLFPREDTEKALLAIEDLMSHYNRAQGEGLVQVWPAPGIPLFVSPEGLVGSLELARKYDAMLTTHLAETQSTSSFQGISVTQYLETLGVLDTRLVAAHCVWMEERDLRLMKKYGAKVVNNVVSNMFLGSGIAPVSTMVSLGIPVGLGTDDANCNDSANMLADMKFAALAQKARQLDAAALSAEKALEMATIDGARAIGLEDTIGSLEAGKRADLIILDMEAPHLKPCHHIPSTLVYQARGTEVESVMVNGKWLLQDRQPLFLKGLQEEKRILADAQRISETILQRAGMQHMQNRGGAGE
jgi:atrazine chlorohydrolase/5-methylthioadenosine/S-adenosylhomocysteine deaminase/melamine deaminase